MSKPETKQESKSETKSSSTLSGSFSPTSQKSKSPPSTPEISVEKEISRIKAGREGGLVIAQTSGALRTMLKDRSDVFVIYDKQAMSGIAEIDIPEIVRNLVRPLREEGSPEIRFIAFPFAINEGHQIAIIIDKQKNQLMIIDSLGFDRTKDQNIKNLIRTIEERTGKKLTPVNGNAESNYQNQANTADSWDSGVHVVHNIVDVVNNKHNKDHKPKVPLELNTNLRQIVIASREYEKIETELENKRQENRIIKSNILNTLEILRSTQQDPQGNLKKLADALQMEQWGTLQGRETFNPLTGTYSGRTLDPRSEQTRERPIEEFITQYEREHIDDVLGIAILGDLKRGGKYKEVIEHYMKVMREYSLEVQSITTSNSQVLVF